MRFDATVPHPEPEPPRGPVGGAEGEEPTSPPNRPAPDTERRPAPPLPGDDPTERS